MPVTKTEKIWMNGDFVKWDDARIHVLSHVVHYGSSWFEGIRCYETARGRAIFRLDRHLRRLFDSAKIFQATIPFSEEQVEEAVIETIRVNNMRACYIRPVVYRGYGEVGVNPAKCPVEIAIAVWEWGTYLGDTALQDGIDVCFSTWNRPAPNTLPSLAKSGGNYLVSQLMKLEAVQGGFKEAIALDTNGHLSEGSGENLFVIKDRVIFTPTIANALLPGVTRASVIQLAGEGGYDVRETNVPRELTYIADEMFFTGTAAEVTPIRSLDRRPVGSGKPGPITLDIQRKFFEIIKEGKDPHHWLKFI